MRGVRFPQVCTHSSENVPLDGYRAKNRTEEEPNNPDEWTDSHVFSAFFEISIRRLIGLSERFYVIRRTPEDD